MKKLALAIALTGFIGTYSIASNFDVVKTEIDGDHDHKKCKDKNCKKCKDENKKSCTKEKSAKGKSCHAKSGGKSCCAKKK